MYQAFFGLTEKPFNLTPDPKFLYLNSSYREALASLHYAIAERKGFASLVGEAGTGKTTLLRRLLSELPRDTRSVLVINPAVSFEELLRFILTDLGRPPTPGTTKLQMTEALNAELLDTLARGGNVVVLVDEAQDLTIPVLEELRLLSNLETAKEKILQIVLAGQPEFESMLARPEIRQLRQRIAVKARLRPLGRREVKAYVAARIAAAGGDERGLFRPAALYRLWRFSGGVPRLLNVACDNALVTAYAAGKRTIGWKGMGEAVRDLSPRAWIGGRGVGNPMSRFGTIAVAVILGAGGAYAVSYLNAERGTAPATNVPVAADVASRIAAPPRAEAPREQPARGIVAGDGASESPEPHWPTARGHRAEPDRLVVPPHQPETPVVEVPPAGASAGAPHGAPTDSAASLERADEVFADGRGATPPGRAPTREVDAMGGRHPAVDVVPKAELGARVAVATEPVHAAVRYVRVERGDTLTAIVHRHYGYVTAGLLDAIKQANPELRDIDVIGVGGTLVLPPAR